MSKKLENFAQDVIKLTRKLPRTPENNILSHQVIRSGASLGANYQEACEAESGRDFIHKLSIIIKESKETDYWLKLVYNSINDNYKGELMNIRNDCAELIRIFTAIRLKFKSHP